MSLTEKAAYLRGLYDGMELGEEKSKEARMLSAVIDVIQELTSHVSENEESIAAIADQVDDVAELLNDCVMNDEDDEEELQFDDEEFDEDDEDFVTTFEVECPNCQKLLNIGEDELATGEIECTTCGQRFQIDLQFENDDEEELQF